MKASDILTVLFVLAVFAIAFMWAWHVAGGLVVLWGG